MIYYMVYVYTYDIRYIYTIIYIYNNMYIYIYTHYIINSILLFDCYTHLSRPFLSVNVRVFRSFFARDDKPSHGRFSLLEVQDMLLALGASGGTCHGPNMEKPWCSEQHGDSSPKEHR